MVSRISVLLLAVSFSCQGTTLQLNSLAFDTSQFRLTEFITGMSGPLSIIGLPDGSTAVASYAGIQRFTDTLQAGIADGPGTTLYSASGAHLGLVQAGSYYIDSNFTGPTSTITILKPGNTAASPWTAVGTLNLDFGSNWLHDNPGIAARPTPGKSDSYDLVFNVGSQYDDQLSTDKVQLSGLTAATLDGDSLYMVTIDVSGANPVASNLRKVATGIRNVVGMGFQPGTGDFYFADNAINGPGPDADEPPQAEEINTIPSAQLGNGPAVDFGYPNCYIQYRTGAQIGSYPGCVQPLFAIQPLPNGTPLGSESEGVAQIGFAPSNFPAGFSNGLFLGFSGKGAVTGPANEENAVGYYDFFSGDYMHFSENSQDGVYQPIGIGSTANALFISDFTSGTVYEVVSATPEPASTLLIASGVMAGFLLVLRRRGAASGA